MLECLVSCRSLGIALGSAGLISLACSWIPIWNVRSWQLRCFLLDLGFSPYALVDNMEWSLTSKHTNNYIIVFPIMYNLRYITLRLEWPRPGDNIIRSPILHSKVIIIRLASFSGVPLLEEHVSVLRKRHVQNNEPYIPLLTHLQRKFSTMNRNFLEQSPCFSILEI